MTSPKTGLRPLLAGGLAALLASVCCIGPLLLIMLGVNGAWIGNLTALEPRRRRSGRTFGSYRAARADTSVRKLARAHPVSEIA